MEILRKNFEPAFLEFAPWAEIPGLFQGVTLRAEERGPEEGLALLSAASRERGFQGACRPAQVHGQRVLDIRLLDNGGRGGFDLRQSVEGDGLAGAEPGLLGVISIADCVPVFLLDRERRAWALLHAGWRGTAAGVLQEGIAVLGLLCGTRPEELDMYLGPAVCGRCYEVEREVAVWLGAEAPGSPGYDGPSESGRWLVDIRAVLAHQAKESGVPSGNIRTSGYCTRCNNDLFHSFRAEGENGLRRMWAFMGFSPAK